MADYSIRQAVDSDKWTVLEWRNHPSVRAVMLTDHLISKDEHSAWWDKTMKMEQRQILIFCRDDRPVGVVTIYAWDRQQATAWWGFYLDNSNLSQPEKTVIWLELEQQLLDYAGATLGLYELYCETLRTNQFVWQLHQKYGFEECKVPQEATSTAKNVIYMKYVYPQNKPDRRSKLYLCASHNTDFLFNTLQKQVARYAQFPYQLKRSEFGRYQLDLRDDNLIELNQVSNSYAFLERVEDFFGDSNELPTNDNLQKVGQRIEDYLAFVKHIALRGNRVYVADFAFQKTFPLSLQEQRPSSAMQVLLSQWNDALYALRSDNLIEVIPYAHLASRQGQSFSNKYWYMARGPFSLSFLEAYSNTIIGTVFASHSLSARALVLDLDNTLWKGVIGDDGLEGIVLGGDYPGNIYKELQSLFFALKQRGILLTICSKNTQQIAVDAINSHPEMRLTMKDFVAHRINWQPKSQNIRELSEQLNLGLQSFCFIDDNPVERAEVRRNAPEVFVPELPQDPADWYQFICNLPELFVDKVDQSDKRRTLLYQQKLELEKAQHGVGDRASFIQSLDMDIVVESVTEGTLARTHQLFTKTNQFNTTTTRYSKKQLSQWMNASSHKVWHVKLKDKYSNDYEGIAALVIIEQPGQWTIDNFVMSCRVMGRDVECGILNALVRLAHQRNVTSLLGRFVATDKNLPVNQLYQKNGFLKSSEDTWELVVSTSHLPAEQNLMKVHWTR